MLTLYCHVFFLHFHNILDKLILSEQCRKCFRIIYYWQTHIVSDYIFSVSRKFMCRTKYFVLEHSSRSFATLLVGTLTDHHAAHAQYIARLTLATRVSVIHDHHPSLPHQRDWSSSPDVEDSSSACVTQNPTHTHTPHTHIHTRHDRPWSFFSPRRLPGPWLSWLRSFFALLI